MPIFVFGRDSIINRVEETTFNQVGLHESELTRLLREYVKVIVPDVLIISKEFGKWEDFKTPY